MAVSFGVAGVTAAVIALRRLYLQHQQHQQELHRLLRLAHKEGEPQGPPASPTPLPTPGPLSPPQQSSQPPHRLSPRLRSTGPPPLSPISTLTSTGVGGGGGGGGGVGPTVNQAVGVSHRERLRRGTSVLGDDHLLAVFNHLADTCRCRTAPLRSCPASVGDDGDTRTANESKRIVSDDADADADVVEGGGGDGDAGCGGRHGDCRGECSTGDRGTIRYEELRTACLHHLRMDIQDAELERVWSRLTARQSGVPLMQRELDFEQFANQARHTTFLQQVVRASLSSAHATPGVASDYDFDRSTNDNHACRDTPRQFYGAFRDIRATRDYSYHVNYTRERQLWQDTIVKSVVVRTDPQVRPWVVYTCGPMGAGKGYTLRWMSQHGFFPLENIVHIDPDYFKSVMVRGWCGVVWCGVVWCDGGRVVGSSRVTRTHTRAFSAAIPSA